MRGLVVFCLFAASAFAGEYAVLATGARLRAERHEIEGSKVRLYAKSGGFSEMDAAQVTGFEAEDYTPPAAAPAAAPEATAAPAPDPHRLADAAADRYGLPRKLVRSVVQAESGFQPQAISRKGAIGLMQLMPGTAEQLGADPHDPAGNVDAGTRHLRDLLVKYDGGLYHALAAYNAGEGAVEKYNGVPPYRETVGYVRRIVKDSGLTTRSTGPAQE